MYELKESGCCPYTLNKEEYEWMVGQFRAKRTSELKKQWVNIWIALGLRSCGRLLKV